MQTIGSQSRVIETRIPHGHVVTLPTRTLARPRQVGQLPIGIAAVILFFSCATMLAPIHFLWQIQPWLVLILLPVGLWLMKGVKFGFRLLMLGISLVYSRSYASLTIEGGQLAYHEHGWGWWKWRPFPSANIDDITALRIESAKLKNSSRSDAWMRDLFGTHCWTLNAYVTNATNPMPLGIAYSQPMLLELADRLRRLASLPPVESVVHTPDSEALAQAEPTPLTPGLLDQPAGSEVTVRNEADHFALHVPPAGIRRGSKGLLMFTVMWNISIAAITGVVVFIAMHDASAWFLALFLLPFVLIGIWTAYTAINMGRTKTAIAIAGGEILFVRENLSGRRTETMPLVELQQVVVGPSGMKINDVPVLELQFHEATGHRGILSHLPNDELRWIADQINARLAASAEDVGEPQDRMYLAK